MVLTGDIFSLIDFFSFAAWMFYGGTMAALIVLRCTKKHAHRPYKVHAVLSKGQADRKKKFFLIG